MRLRAQCSAEEHLRMTYVELEYDKNQLFSNPHRSPQDLPKKVLSKASKKAQNAPNVHTVEIDLCQSGLRCPMSH